MSDDEPIELQQAHTSKPGSNGQVPAPDLVQVLRDDVIRDLQDQLRLARLFLSVPDPSPRDYQTDRPLPDPW